MEDRWSKLAVTAHLDGTLDFTHSKRGHSQWLLKERFVLDATEDRVHAEVTKLAHEWHCSMAARASLMDDGDEDSEFHRKEAVNTFNIIGKLCLSWYKGWEKERDRLVEAWLAMKRQDKDPVFQAKRAAVKKAMRDKMAASEADAVAMAAANAAGTAYWKEQSTRVRSRRGGRRR